MNPRVLLWLEHHGLTPDDIARPSGEDVRMVTIHGERNLWTVHYSQWIMGCWHEWATSLGFKRTAFAAAHNNARLAGHSDAEFDAWLERKVRGDAVGNGQAP